MNFSLGKDLSYDAMNINLIKQTINVYAVDVHLYGRNLYTMQFTIGIYTSKDSEKCYCNSKHLDNTNKYYSSFPSLSF